jgi:glutamate-1-semialdehyde aminotransferase
MSQKLTLTRSEALFAEAKTLLPGGVLGIRKPSNFVPGEYPVFIDHGYAGHLVDVDGNDYIDMLAAYGPIIIGYVEPEIDQAVIAQMRKGFCFTLVQEWHNRLLTRLRELMPCAEMGLLVKTGSDATLAAVRIARGHTGRDRILRCGYHGWHDWAVESHGGIPRSHYENTIEFPYNDLDHLEDLFKANDGRVAGVIITPLNHALNHPVEEPAPGYLQGVKDLCRKHGAVLIFDEIRTGFRASLGGAQQLYGVTPDLATIGKALANGYAISAVVGRREVISSLEKVFVSSTFFPNSLEMVAALKCLEMLERDRLLERVWALGERFLAGCRTAVARHDLPVTVSGIPPMPFLTFDHDAQGRYKARRTRFYTETIRRGLFIQPFHHYYTMARHTEADVDRAVAVIDEALGIVAREVG